MKKQEYVKPSLEVVIVKMGGHLLDLSIPIGSGAGPGGGGQSNEYRGFDDDPWSEDEENSENAAL